MLERLVLSGRTERKGAKRRALVRPFGHDALKIRFVLYLFFIFYVRFFFGFFLFYEANNAHELKRKSMCVIVMILFGLCCRFGG